MIQNGQKWLIICVVFASTNVMCLLPQLYCVSVYRCAVFVHIRVPVSVLFLRRYMCCFAPASVLHLRLCWLCACAFVAFAPAAVLFLRLHVCCVYICSCSVFVYIYLWKFKIKMWLKAFEVFVSRTVGSTRGLGCCEAQQHCYNWASSAAYVHSSSSEAPERVLKKLPATA